MSLKSIGSPTRRASETTETEVAKPTKGETMLIFAFLLLITIGLGFINTTLGIVFGIFAGGIFTFLWPRIMRRARAMTVLRDEFGFQIPDKLVSYLNDSETALRSKGANEFEVAATFLAIYLKDPQRLGFDNDIALYAHFSKRIVGLADQGKIRPQVLERISTILESQNA